MSQTTSDGLNKEITQEEVKTCLISKLDTVATKLQDFNADSNTKLDAVASTLAAFNAASDVRQDQIIANTDNLNNPLNVDTGMTQPLTDTQLRATPVPISGTVTINGGGDASVLFRGRASSFRTLGRAGTAGQKIFAIHNAVGSTITIKINKITVDMFCTVVKAITVAPPIVRIWKFTAVPTNGTQVTKNKIGGTTTSNASCTLWNDSSADGTGSGTTLTVTLPAGTILDQKIVPRVITAAGEISQTNLEFEYPKGIQLGALEGVCVFLNYTLATQNPVTDMWVVSAEFEESLT